MRDRVIERPEGFYCVVNGREFGAWATEALARGGMQVEQCGQATMAVRRWCRHAAR